MCDLAVRDRNRLLRDESMSGQRRGIIVLGLTGIGGSSSVRGAICLAANGTGFALEKADKDVGGRFMSDRSSARSRLSRSDSGRWQLPVPWEQAGRLHRELARLGYSSRLHLNGLRKEAHLELAPEVAPAEALLALIGATAAPAALAEPAPH
jgi:hypothetical protein